MLGDYFNIQNQDQLSWRQINNLIIEARLKRVNRLKTSNSDRHTEHLQERDEKKVTLNQRRLERIENKEIQIEQANKRAERSAADNASREKILENVEAAMKRAGSKRENNSELMKERHERNVAKDKEAFKEAVEHGEEFRLLKKQYAEKGQERLEERRTASKEALENAIAEHKFQTAQNKVRVAERHKREELRKEATQKNKELTEAGLQSSASYRQKIQDRKETATVDGQNRSAARQEIAGDPAAKRIGRRQEEAIRATKAQGNRVERRKELKELFLEMQEVYREWVKAAYNGGDIHRDTKAAIVIKARRVSYQRLEGIFNRRWKNLFPGDKLSQRFFTNVGNKIYFELKHRQSQESVERQETLKSMWAESLEKTNARKADLEERFSKSLERRNRLLHEPGNATSLFEHAIENLIKKGTFAVDKDLNDVIQECLKEKKEEKVFPEETNPAGKDWRHVDVSIKSSPIPNDNLEIPRIITYADDRKSLSEETAVEDMLQSLRQANDKKEAKTEQTMQEDKQLKARQDAAKEVQNYTLMEYYRRLIETQNKTAHQRAVEAGQFINFFF